MADTSPEEIDAILATQYTHYLDTNYDVELTTNGEVDWSATETYDAFLATETTAQALYYQAIESGLLELGLSRFDLSTLSPEQVFKNAIGHVEIQKGNSTFPPIPLRTEWDADNDDSTIFFQSGWDLLIPDSLQWAITREFGQVLDHRSFNYGTSELQRTGVSHQETIVSGFSNDTWHRSNAGMLDMSYVGGPTGVTESFNNTANGAEDEWADMFAHWVNFTNFRMTQPYDLSEKELQSLFITDYLGIPSIDNVDLSTFTAQQLNLIAINLEKGLNPNSGLIFNENEAVDEGLKPYLIETIHTYRSEYDEMVNRQMPTYFDRMSSMDNWVSGSLFTANLWREPSFQQNLRNEMQAVEASGVLEKPIFNDYLTGTTYPINDIDGLPTVNVHADLKNNTETYEKNILSLENLSPTSLKDTYQAQRQLLLRVLPALLYTENSSFPDVVTGNRQAISSNSDIYQYTPYQFHSFSNAELGMLTQLALTHSDPQMYDQMVAWYESDEFRPDGNVRDVTGASVVSQVATVVEERPWFVDAAMFAGSMLCEPIDWALSGVEAFSYALDGNLAGAGLILGLTLLPGGITRVADDFGWLGRHVDDIAEKYPRPVGGRGPSSLDIEDINALNSLGIDGLEILEVNGQVIAKIDGLEIMVEGGYPGTEYGIASNRWFINHPQFTGDIIRPLTYHDVSITHQGIDIVEVHLNRFGQDEANDIMVNRLRQIANGTLKPDNTDLKFYTHELREYERWVLMGWDTVGPVNPNEFANLWNNTHAATLEDYNLTANWEDLYHESARK